MRPVESEGAQCLGHLLSDMILTGLNVRRFIGNMLVLGMICGRLALNAGLHPERRSLLEGGSEFPLCFERRQVLR